jgi:WD40 repeat protein
LEAEGPVRILSFSSDGSKLASESGGDVFIWDVTTGQKIGSIPETFMSGDFFNNQQTWRDTGYVSISDNVLAIADHNTVNIINLHNGKRENRYTYPTIYEGAYINPDGTKKPEIFYLPVHNVFFSSDEKYLISTLSITTQG